MKDRADEVAAKVSREAITRENGVEEIDKLVAEVSGIQRVATETTVMLPPYDVRRTQEEIQALQKKLQQLRDSFAPKKKFAFKSRASKPSSSSSKETAASAVETKQEDAATPAQETVTPYPPNTNVICDKAGEVLRVTRDQMGTSNDVLIKDCSDSTIFMYATCPRVACAINNTAPVLVCADTWLAFFGLVNSPHVLGFARLENVSRCTVVLGPVAGACYLEGCTDSTIAVCCHQVRAHVVCKDEFPDFVLMLRRVCVPHSFGYITRKLAKSTPLFRQTPLSRTALSWALRRSRSPTLTFQRKCR